MSDNKQMVVKASEKVIGNNYGAREDIRELMERFKAGLPNVPKAEKDFQAPVIDAGLRALAMMSIAHDLDAWNGEAWLIYNRKKNETSVIVGVKGMRKVARRQLEDREQYYTSYKVLKPDQYAEYGVKGKDIELVCICTLTRTDTAKEYMTMLRDLRDMCDDFDTARKMLGEIPVFTGIGIVRTGDKSRMERAQLVKKRSEMDSLKQAFDLPFANSEADVENGGWDVVDVTPDLLQLSPDNDDDNGTPPKPAATVDTGKGKKKKAAEKKEPVSPEDVGTDLEATPVNKLTGKQMYDIKQQLSIHDKHFLNRYKSRFEVDDLSEITALVGEFVRVMSLDEWPEEEPEADAKDEKKSAVDEAFNRFLEREQSWAEDGKPPATDSKKKGNIKTLSEYPEWNAPAEVVLDVTMKQAGVTIGDFSKVPEHKGEIMPINKIKTKYSPAEISKLITQIADLKAESVAS